MKRKLTLLTLWLSVATLAFGQTSRVRQITEWEFSRDEVSWEKVRVPHDWAIAGPFDKKWDMQVVAIEQNGEKVPTEKTGRSGALPWVGKGVYRTTINLTERDLQHAQLCFDGAMSEPRVFVNGREAGYWPYGYNAFRIDITRYVHVGENAIEVRLQNIEESTRWYPGGGIYRPVELLTTGSMYIEDWSVYARTLNADKNSAAVAVDATVVNAEEGTRVRIAISDGETGDVVAQGVVEPNAVNAVSKTLIVREPHLWSPESPYRYLLTLSAEVDGTIVDEYQTHIGIRTISVSRDGGFQLNGQRRKLQGVCLHHDLGPLGAAVNRAALERQVRILKEMGCDAIRTSHNMPSTLQMEVCDSMGMMVMAESFDMWVTPKCKNGYSRFFREWADKDMENLVMNHRNHPSIVMWSIGNEIPDQWNEEGRDIARRLQDICHLLDPSRPVTQGIDWIFGALQSGNAQVLDVPGMNYRVHLYDTAIDSIPQGFVLGSENASTMSSRGIYYFPVEPSDHANHGDGQCSSYDVDFSWWSNLPDDDFQLMENRDYTIGQFVWTGFDYLGEPTPYDEYWPSRSSYFGICDLAGLPKDRYYLYRSQWNKAEHTIHLLPHWTWPGREGEVTPVYCYTDYPEAELFVNGKSQGRIRKNTGPYTIFSNPDVKDKDESSLDHYRLRWNNVRYEPGEVKVVVYDENGRQAGEQTVTTAGRAARFKLESNRQTIKADGDDLAFITVSLVDKNGVEVPTATDQLAFSVKGAGSYRAACNGDATSLEPFTKPTMRLFSGKLVVVVQASQSPGDLILTVSNKTNKRIKPATIRISVE